MNKKHLRQCVEEVWKASELRFKETLSCKALTDFLKAEGFTVEVGVGNIATAFTASIGSGRPHIGLLAEYDALSGLSQKQDCMQQSPREETDCGHGCGHHLLGGAVVEAACLIKELLPEGKGTITVFGCPGEEGGSGKAFMAREGIFDDLDCALTWHPSSINAIGTGSSQANVQAYFHFHGVASHAAGSPHLGRSALDAVELMNVAVNYLREHMEDTDRVHYAVVNTGGKSPNVVQAEASVLYLVRSTTAAKAKRLYERVINCAKGAALMTDTTLDIEFDKACSNTIPNETLETVLYEAMLKCPLPEYTEEEKAYAAGFKATVPEETLRLSIPKSIQHDRNLVMKYLNDPLCSWVTPYVFSAEPTMGSTDVSDVSWVVPTAQINAACYCMGTPGHSWQLTAQGLSEVAFKGMDYTAEVLKEAVMKLLENPQLIEKAKAEHEELREGKPYECPIPAGIQPRTNY